MQAGKRQKEKRNELNDRDECLLVAEEIGAGTDASTRLLFWLLQHPFQAIEDIALAFRWRPSSAYRRVRDAEEQGMVESIAYQCHRTKATMFYYLSPSGIRMVARLLGTNTYEVAACCFQHDADLLRWLPRLQSQRALQQMINLLVEDWPEHNPLTTRTSWRWFHEFTTPFLSGHERGKYVADALLVFSNDHASTSVMFVLDPGYAAEQYECVIRQRVEALWQFRVAYEQNFPSQKIPLIFILTPSEQNRVVWERVIHAMELQRGMQFLQGATVAYRYDEALPPVDHLPWRQIHNGALCNPFDFLSSHWTHEGIISKGLIPILPYSVSERKKRSALKGRLMERALALSPSVKTDCSEQELIALLGLHFHRRHLDLLNVIYQRPFLKCAEIADLLYVDHATVQRSLVALMRWKCVREDRTFHEKRYSLGFYGLRFISAMFGMELRIVRDLSQ